MTKLDKKDIYFPYIASEDTANWWKILKKTGAAAKKSSTARKPSTAAKKKPAPKSDEAALLDALVGLLK